MSHSRQLSDYHRTILSLEIDSQAVSFNVDLIKDGEITTEKITCQTSEGRTEDYILKRINRSNSDANDNIAKEAFYSELSAYIFLNKYAPAFTGLPKAIDISPNQGLLMKRIQQRDEDLQINDELLIKLASMFAKLHSETWNKKDDLDSTRRELGLSSIERSCYHAQEEMLYIRGVETFLKLVDETNEGKVKISISELKEIENLSFNEVNDVSFVHNDLIDSRHCLLNKHKLVFIDLERGRYAPPIIDIARLLVGKYERSIDDDIYYRNNPLFPTYFINTYRDALNGNGISYTEEEWDRQTSASLIALTLIEIGRITLLNETDEIHGGIDINMYILIKDLQLLISPYNCFLETKNGISTIVEFLKKLSN